MTNSDALPTAPRVWARPLMRIGYCGRGVVYAAVGGLTIASCLTVGSDDTATHSALVAMRDMPLGGVVLSVVGVAFLFFAAWSVANALFDLDEYGRDAKGLFSRLAIVVVGLLHAAFGVVAFLVAWGRTGGDGESGIDAATAMVMGWPLGRPLVALVGLVTIGSGLYFLKRAFHEDYREKIVSNPMTQRMNPLMRFGVVAHGVVIMMVGAFFVIAAWTFQPDRAGGMQQAFDMLRAAVAGRMLLGAVGVGFLGFALVCFVKSAYRVVPARVSQDDPRTLLSGERAGRAFEN